MEKFKRRFYDSHPELPLDPDSEQAITKRLPHTDGAHILVVAFGGFFGTLARYQLGLLLPVEKNGWPIMTFMINIAGAFVLGLLLESLTRRGKDEGGRRAIRLLLGTGFLGAFTTYSSLATGVVILWQNNETMLALLYGFTSLVFGVFAAALGIQIAAKRHISQGARL